MPKSLSIRPSDEAKSHINAIGSILKQTLPENWMKARMYVQRNNGIQEWKGAFSIESTKEMPFYINEDLLRHLEILRSEEKYHYPISTITFHSNRRYEINYEYTLPKRLSLNKIQEEIKKLQLINFENVDVDSVKKHIQTLTKGYMLTTPTILEGTRLYRGTQWQEKPCTVDQLSYPPKEKVNKLHRAGRPQQPLFYCSFNHEAIYYELNVKVGDKLAVSKWETSASLLVNNVGYRPDVLKNLGSNRKFPSWCNVSCPKEFESHNKLVGDFFAKEFTKKVPVGQEYLYKLSAAIAEQHFQQEMFDGLMYPAVAMKGNADNLSIKPSVVDTKLVLKTVQYIHVNECCNNSYKITKLDFANSFDAKGQIEWKGRLPHWVLRKQGEVLHVVVENGKWVARNPNGEIIEPE